jgi:hypothetical protein
MKIHKISKYVPISTPSRGSSSETGVRHMLISLARVRWLEREPDPKSFTSRYKTQDDFVDTENVLRESAKKT